MSPEIIVPNILTYKALSIQFRSILIRSSYYYRRVQYDNSSRLKCINICKHSLVCSTQDNCSYVRTCHIREPLSLIEILEPTALLWSITLRFTGTWWSGSHKKPLKSNTDHPDYTELSRSRNLKAAQESQYSPQVDQEPQLRNITFSVEPGTKIGVGSSQNGGKNFIVPLIFRWVGS
jgi:hypothetical protein